MDIETLNTGLTDSQVLEAFQKALASISSSDVNTLLGGYRSLKAATEAIPNGANLNSYTTAGKYYRGSGGTTNLPNGFNAAYYLIVEETIADNRYRQWVIPAASAVAGEIYTRISTGDAINWQSWYKFTGEVVT